MRGLASNADATRLDLDARVGAVLDEHLRVGSARPVCVALSGGGDSLALLLAADAWARRTGRALVVLTVDHRLRAQSAAWTAECATIAARMNRPFRALSWVGDKPKTGLPAAARAARHALLANAAREVGAHVILFGHTADDCLEARAMREAGSSTPEPRTWSPSPAWPEGRGIFLLRPMLGARRAEIRDWLRARGETWIEDPANDDTAFARPRARQAIGGGPSLPPPPRAPSARTLALSCRVDGAGALEISRAAVRDADPATAAHFVSVACLCAGGTGRPPARPRTASLTQRLTGTPSFVATLAGARIEAGSTMIRILREIGEAARGGLKPLRLRAGETRVWDGRFEVTTDRDVEVRPAPGSTHPDFAGARSLIHDRMLAACGVIDREPD